MKSNCCKLVLSVLIAVLRMSASAATAGGDWNVAYLDQILSNSPPDQTTIQLGDMVLLKTNVTAWRDQLAGTPSPQSAFGGTAPTWPGGNVYYDFSTNTGTAIPLASQQAFIDATAEWPTFANVHFYRRTTQSNYAFVQLDSSIGGGESAVGMQGGAQFFHVNPNAFNRVTLVHELGHTLGLVHEHQRSDRDSYVTVFSNNVVSGQLGNFVKLGDSLNQGAYDFLSVMHYSRNALANSGTDTIEPLPQYSQYLNVIGVPGNLVLSALDRSGMAAIYGTGPTLSSVVSNTVDGGVGSLRAALYYAYDHPGTTVTFNISTNDAHYSNGVFTIQLTDQLPSLVNATTLDGTTQPANGHVGPTIVINGLLAPTPSTFANGLRFAGTNCLARSLVINNFADCAVIFDGATAVSNTLSGCYLGLDSTGNIAVTNGLYPVLLQSGASGNLVGGSTAAARNLISGGLYQGIVLSGTGTHNNSVQGNYIGLGVAGTNAVPNGYSGVFINSGASSNLIGGSLATQRNVISGNLNQGLLIRDTNTVGNVVCGNYLGLNAAGTAAIPNSFAGIQIYSGAQSNIIGSTLASQRNVISGNTDQGILINGLGAAFNLVEGNYIGVNPAGSAAIANGYAGIQIAGGAQSNVIGGSVTGAGNVLSGNLSQGIYISDAGTSSNWVQGNFIGTDATGAFSVPNAYAGVEIAVASSNTIGGFTAATRNIISGNSSQGVIIDTAGANGNVVAGNYLGVNATGTAALGNGFSGIQLASGAQNNVVGGSLPGAANVISGNTYQGVAISDPGTSGNLILGNYIGVNASGLAAIPNEAGIEFYNAPTGNTAGAFGARNIISGNTGNRVQIDGTNTAQNIIQANTIGLGITGLAVPNGNAGVQIFSGAASNFIGGLIAGTANVVASNNYDGVDVFNAGATNNTVRGNSIYGNANNGFAIYNTANNSAAAPALSTAVLTTNLTVAGSLSSLANTLFHLDFYASPVGAQGKTYLGFVNVTTSSSGAATFSNALGALVPIGQKITATATDPAGNTSSLSAAVTVTATDSIGDGIPNAWRAAHFGGSGTTTNSSSCATCDPDHDGRSNLQEFYAGTDPNSATNVLKFKAIARSGPDVIVTIPSISGIAYRLESKDNLVLTNWTLLGDQILGTGTLLPLTNSGVGTLPQRFYRLSALP